MWLSYNVITSVPGWWCGFDSHWPLQFWISFVCNSVTGSFHLLRDKIVIYKKCTKMLLSLFLVSCRFFLCGESPFAAGRPVEIVNVPREPYWLWYGSPGGTRHRYFYKMEFTVYDLVRWSFYQAGIILVSLKGTFNNRNRGFRCWSEDLTAPERMQDPGAVGWWSVR